MKRGTPEHPKTIDLANRLGVPRYVAVGILESLWHFTSEFAPQGNIGKFTDAAIAGHIHWEKECKDLVTFLIEAKWVDKCAKHRLIVHDWHEHADQTVKRWLEKRGLQFLHPEHVTRNRSSRGHASTKLANASTEKADPPPQAGLPLPLPLPLPEPIPEPGPQPPAAPERAGALPFTNQRWKGDEQFARFVADYLATGAALIDSDFSKAYEVCWKRLDIQQKLDRVAALVRHSEEYHSDPRFVPNPLKFLETEWQRPVRPKSRDSPGRRERSFVADVEAAMARSIQETGKPW